MVVKNRVAFVSIFTVIVAVIMIGFFLFNWQIEDGSTEGSAEETTAAVNLGISYLLITPQLSDYYDLGVNSGVLVTEVIPYSLADQAGVKVGDIILSFNGARLERGAPLYGMMMSCTLGNSLVLEICRGKGTSIIEFVYIER